MRPLPLNSSRLFDMDDLAKYIVSYYQHLMTVEERAAYRSMLSALARPSLSEAAFEATC